MMAMLEHWTVNLTWIVTSIYCFGYINQVSTVLSNFTGHKVLFRVQPYMLFRGIYIYYITYLFSQIERSCWDYFCRRGVWRICRRIHHFCGDDWLPGWECCLLSLLCNQYIEGAEKLYHFYHISGFLLGILAGRLLVSSNSSPRECICCQ